MIGATLAALTNQTNTPNNQTANIKLDVWGPTQNATDAGPLSPNIVGFSLEPAFVSQFLGNSSTGPNQIFVDLFAQVEQRMGGLAIR